MLYDYQYDVAAIVATFLLLSIYLIRKSYETKSTKIFLSIIVVDFLAALFDAISCFTISYPEKYSLAFSYVVCYGYFFFYNLLSTLFLVYIDSKAKIEKYRKPVIIVTWATIAFYMVTIFSSPWTHAVAYFDENRNYMHGPVMYVLYIMPFIIILWELQMFYAAKDRFNRYQIIASVAIILAMLVSIAVQMVIKRMLIGQLNMSLVLYFVYMSYENPAYFTFRETQCLNQRAFYETIKDLLRKKKTKFSLIMFHLTDYEYVRHNWGAQYSDKVSSKVAEHFYLEYRKNVFCLSEDKFVIIVHESEERNIQKIEEHIKDFFMESIRINDTSVKMSVSISKLCDLDDHLYEEEILDLVDYCIHHPEEESSASELIEKVINEKHRRETIIHAIKKALDHDEFQVFYQPIYSTASRNFHSAEALIRLYNPELGYINPEEMITIAESNGYIDQIGEVVFRKVCQFISCHDMEQYGLKYIEINLSPIQCMRQDLVEMFSKIMREYNVSSDRVNLEITETASFVNERQIFSNIHRLNEMGIEFSIDDFGSGFASADYLIKLPVSIVKIDKTILWEAMEKENAMVVLINSIRMLKDLGKKIVVEGVEDEKMVNILVKEECDYLQGYYYSKPINEMDFVSLLQKWV